MRIVVTGGGTGGHISPLVAVIEELTREPGVDLLWIGSSSGPEQKAAESLGVQFRGIQTGKFRRYFDVRTFADILRVPVGLVQAYAILLQYNPDVVFGKGSSVSLIVILAAWLLGKRIIVHESDTVPGWSNRIASFCARRVLLGFASSKRFFPRRPPKLFQVTGIPVRQYLHHVDKEWAYAFLNAAHNRPTILILSGSQGASRVNQVVVGCLEQLLESAQVIHISGERHYDCIRRMTGQFTSRGYHLYKTLGKELGLAYELADVVISRAGASSLAELALFAKPTIVIPLPGSAGGHQAENARFYKLHGACELLHERDLDGTTLIARVRSLLDDANARTALATNVYKLAHPNAAAEVARSIMKISSHAAHAHN